MADNPEMSPENPAAGAVWLASPLADGITGQVLKIMGGYAQIVENWTPATQAETDGIWTIDALEKAKGELFAGRSTSRAPVPHRQALTRSDRLRKQPLHILEMVVAFVGDVADHGTHRDLVAGADHDPIEVVVVQEPGPRREACGLFLEAVEHLVGIGVVVVLILRDRIGIRGGEFGPVLLQRPIGERAVIANRVAEVHDVLERRPHVGIGFRP